ncbi:MAG: type IV pilus biogenesis protein PilP [Proteobacteria bacterium]|nr:type IV pilus biogenesis protein PilP [Pseudomonadota bacterium]
MTMKANRYPILLAILLLGSFVTLPGFAQDAPPPESQLMAPAGDLPQPSLLPTEAPAPEQPVAPQAQHTSSHGGGSTAFDPCPAPKDAIMSSPDDLAKVQEEIDRFTLCVQRAQLLERLNETALKSEMATDAALGLGGSIPGIPNPQETGLAPLPASALAGADVSPTSDSKAGDDVPEADSESEAAAAAPVVEEAAPAPWTIKEVYGSGADMKAKLISPDGDETRVGEGAKLPGGKGSVVRITPSSVTIRIDGDTKDLSWARN